MDVFLVLRSITNIDVIAGNYCFPIKDYFYFIVGKDSFTFNDSTEGCQNVKGTLPSAKDPNMFKEVDKVIMTIYI